MKLWMVPLFAVLLNISSNVIAAVGTVTEQVNTPGSIQRSGKALPAAKGTGVEMNDLVNTTKGKVGITFQDETRVEVNENSKLIIDDFVYDPKKPAAGKVALNMASGTVRYASGAIAKNNPSKVAINTPSATIAVRGTDFTATVDELGESTIILLPSCPKGWADIEKDCKTGAIDVMNDAGMVSLNKPFEGTKVATRGSMPMKPVVLNLTADTINNLLILSPPKELSKDKDTNKNTVIYQAGNMLEQNFLKQDFLKNELSSNTPFGDNPLARPLLQQYFLENIFDILSEALQAEGAGMLGNVLNADSLLPDYDKSMRINVFKDSSTVTLTRTIGTDVESVMVPRSQNSTIIQTQDGTSAKNRVNTGGSTFITITQK
jgi:hypothetical protein